MGENSKKKVRISDDERYKKTFSGKMGLLLDHVRLEIVKLTKNVNVANKIKNDYVKLDAINILDESIDKASIAERITDDEIKLKSIGLIEEAKYKARVAITLHSDDNKKEAIKLVEDYMYKSMIAGKLSNDQERVKQIDIFKKGSIADLAHNLDVLNEISDYAGRLSIVERILKKYPRDNLLEKINEQLEICNKLKETNSDDKKIEGLEGLDNDFLKSEVIKTIENEEKRVELIASLKEDVSRTNAIRDLSDKQKINVLKSIREPYYQKVIIGEIQDVNNKMKALSIIPEDIRLEAIFKIDDNDLQIYAMKKYARNTKDIENYILQKEAYTDGKINKNINFKILKEFAKDIANTLKSKDDNEKIKLLENENIENENLKLEIAITIEDRKKRIENINKLGLETVKKYRQGSSIEFIKDNFEEFLILEKVNPEKIEKIKNIVNEMYKANNSVVHDIDFQILEDDRFIQELGIDKINQISCYPEIQKQVIGLSESELKVFSKCIENCNNTRWTPLAQAVLENLPEYKQLIENISKSDIEKIDFEKINIIIQDKNIFNINTLEDIENIEHIKKERCKEWIESNKISQKKQAVLEKIFGQSLEYSESIIAKYGEDIESIPDGDCKDYIRSVKTILEMQDPSKVEEIYANCKEVENIDKISIEESLKKEYGKLFNEGLFSIEKAEKSEEGVYEAGTDFKMILTSLGAYETEKILNYPENWNRPAISSQHFCASYIRNDMIGIAPIYSICYRIFKNGR